MKLTKSISTFLIILAILICCPAATSQICRVAVEARHDGSRTYIEVYEYDYVTRKPEFPGGDNKLVEYINRERHYPQAAYKRGVQGRVTCSFVVNTNGAISHVMVIRGVEATLDKEAVRIFEHMPHWRPGYLHDTQVPVRVIRSVPFRI